MFNEKITCRIAVQTCVGCFPDGRKRHRTFSLRHVRPDVSPQTIRSIIRALAPVLAHPITKVRKVTKREVFSDRDGALITSSTQVDVVPIPAEHQIVRREIEHDTAESSSFAASTEHIAESSSCALPRQKVFMPGRAPPKGLTMIMLTGGM